MSYGLGNYVNNKVSDPVLFIFTVLQLDIKEKKNVVPKGFYFCTRLDRHGRKIPIGRFLIYFLPVKVYARNQNSRLQLNVF